MSTVIQKLIEIDYTVEEMRQGVVDFLTHNPGVVVNDLALSIVSGGMDIVYASKITGILIEEIVKLQHVKH